MVCDDSPDMNFACRVFFLILPEDILIDFREKEKESERKGEKH